MKEPLETVTGAGQRLGEYIRDQRRGSQISLRQLATLAGVSNPYLSQIERGLRKPSAEILQQIAKGLRISAEALYLQAGILEQRAGDPAVVDAVLGDEGLSERQKQVLLEIYDSFRKENAPAQAPAPIATPIATSAAAGTTPAVAAPPAADASPPAQRLAKGSGTGVDASPPDRAPQVAGPPTRTGPARRSTAPRSRPAPRAATPRASGASESAGPPPPEEASA